MISIDNSCNNDIVIIDNLLSLPEPVTVTEPRHSIHHKSAWRNGPFQVKEEIFSLMVTIPLHNITV